MIETMAGRVFRRTLDPTPPVAARADGVTIWDATGKAYLDAAGGAIVVGIGHGRRSVADVMAYQAWLGRFRHVSAAYPYRAGEPNASALGTAEELADELDRTIQAAEPGTVAAFVGEPLVGATLGAVAPPAGYWEAIAEVCRRNGVLLVADEVMTGFGRTGRWFGIEHSGVKPDLLVAAKGS